MQIISLFGPDTRIAKLRGGLEEQMATQRGIAQRVADAQQVSSREGFAQALEAQGAARPAPAEEVDLNREMASLADTQIRYEATARLLSSAYAKLREVIRDRA